MVRFSRNRLWTFILAMSLCMGGVAVLHTGTAHAADPPAVSDDQGSGGGLGNGYGDPDAPSGSAKRAALRGGAQVASGGSTIVGDDAGLQSAWMWRLRIALQMLRGTWIHP
jgi:hypothetical protein